MSNNTPAVILTVAACIVLRNSIQHSVAQIQMHQKVENLDVFNVSNILKTHNPCLPAFDHIRKMCCMHVKRFKKIILCIRNAIDAKLHPNYFLKIAH